MEITVDYELFAFLKENECHIDVDYAKNTLSVYVVVNLYQVDEFAKILESFELEEGLDAEFNADCVVVYIDDLLYMLGHELEHYLSCFDEEDVGVWNKFIANRSK